MRLPCGPHCPADGRRPRWHQVDQTPGEYIALQGASRLHLSATIEYEIIEDSALGLWRISTHKYMYHVVTNDHTEVILYHWHPGGKGPDQPHVHLGSSQLRPNSVVQSSNHVPSGRISFEAVLTYLITDLRVVALRTDYLQVLAKNNRDFEARRTWSTTHNLPIAPRAD